MRKLATVGKLVIIGALVITTGCSMETPASTEPNPEFDQKGHAAGGHPQTERFLDVFHETFAEGEFCVGFAVEVEGESRVVVQAFESHLVVRNNYRATWTNLSTGYSFEDNGSWTDIIHFDGEGNEETLTTIGSIFRIVIPGQGIVGQDTGIITFDSATGEILFEGGPHDFAHGVGPDFCTLLMGVSS